MSLSAGRYFILVSQLKILDLRIVFLNDKQRKYLPYAILMHIQIA
jgi:hypothetical protein